MPGACTKQDLLGVTGREACLHPGLSLLPIRTAGPFAAPHTSTPTVADAYREGPSAPPLTHPLIITPTVADAYSRSFCCT